MNTGNWNVCTMYVPWIHTLEIGKWAQIANIMREYKIDILGISKCRWTESGKLKLVTGETVIYSGRDDGIHWSRVAIRSKFAESALLEQVLINGRIIMAQFFSKYNKLTVIHVYAPTMEAEEKDILYEQLSRGSRKSKQTWPFTNNGVRLWKLDHQTRTEKESWANTELGLLIPLAKKLINFCVMKNLITGTIFPHKEMHNTW